MKLKKLHRNTEVKNILHAKNYREMQYYFNGPEYIISVTTRFF